MAPSGPSAPSPASTGTPSPSGALHAARRSIVVACSAGNDGLAPATVSNLAPWVITVDGGGIDRAFRSPVTLGSGMVITCVQVVTMEGEVDCIISEGQWVFVGVPNAVKIGDYAAHNYAILLVVIPASQAPKISSSRALRLAKEFDSEGTRTIGVISKIDQAAGDQKSLAAVLALLLNQGPRSAADIQWVALIGQSVSIASAQAGSVGSENSLETAWRAESESLRSILTGAPQSKLGRVALVDTLAKQIRKRMKVRLPNLLSGWLDDDGVHTNKFVILDGRQQKNVDLAIDITV